MNYGNDRQNDWSDEPQGSGWDRQRDGAVGGGRPPGGRPQRGPSAAEVGVEERMGFIRRTYAHLAGAIFALVLLETVLFQVGAHEFFVPLMVGTQYSWLIVLGLFVGAGWLANKWAMSPHSQGLQYMGLGLYVGVWAIMLLPMISIAGATGNASAIPTAAALTLLVFGALTAFVFITKQDFSFLSIALVVATLLAFGGIVASIIFGFQLGIWFSVFMVGLASLYILYYTSNVLHHYHPEQHVAASLALFSSIALLFWYILSIFLGAGE